MSVRAVATLDLVIARETNGTVMVTKIAMMAITTSISTSVKPLICVTGMDEFELDFMVIVLVAFPVADDAQFFWFADLHPNIVALTIVFGVAGIIFPSLVLF